MTDHELTAFFQRQQLHRAAENGDLAQINKLLQQKYPVNRFDELGKTTLHYAVRGDHQDVVDLLIQSGADINAHDERKAGNTPLGDNIGKCSFEMAKKLIDAGADPTIPGWMQLDALHRAGLRKDANAAKIQRLLQEAANRKRI